MTFEITRSTRLKVTTEQVKALQEMNGISHSCPSESKAINYKIDQYKQPMAIQVTSVTSDAHSATIQVELSHGYEIRQRVVKDHSGINTSNKAQKDSWQNGYWNNIFWTTQNNGNAINVKANDILDVVKTENGQEVPVAAIDIIAVHPKGQIIEPGTDRIADENYIFANVIHAPLYNPNTARK